MSKQLAREEAIDLSDRYIWSVFTPPGADGPMCAWCHRRVAVCVHEITPKSLRPGDWWEVTNRMPLCDRCHQQAGRERVSGPMDEEAQRRARDLALANVTGWRKFGEGKDDSEEV